MLFAEFLALLAILGGGGLGITALVSWGRAAEVKRKATEKKSEEMHKDLRAALKARDYKLLEDWLVLYGDYISTDLRKHVELRKDELFIEKNP